MQGFAECRMPPNLTQTSTPQGYLPDMSQSMSGGTPLSPMTISSPLATLDNLCFVFAFFEKKKKKTSRRLQSWSWVSGVDTCLATLLGLFPKRVVLGALAGLLLQPRRVSLWPHLQAA